MGDFPQSLELSTGHFSHSISVHPKLHNIKLHNVTHSLIRNPRERMFVVQISLLIVAILFLISQNLSLMQAT
jgi:hypothetical protein